MRSGGRNFSAIEFAGKKSPDLAFSNVDRHALQPSLNNELARNLVETHIKVANGRREMPTPFKSEVLETLPNDYESAVKRTLSLRRNAAKNHKLKQILLDTFAE